MLFKHTEIIVPSIAIKSTTFFFNVRKAQTDNVPSSRHGCFLSQLLSLSITNPWIFNLSLPFSLIMSVWLHVYTDFSKVTHYSRSLSLALFWSVQSGKTHSSISSQAVSDLFQLQLVFMFVCVSWVSLCCWSHHLYVESNSGGWTINSIRDNWNCLQHKWPFTGYRGNILCWRQVNFFFLATMTTVHINKGPHDQNVVFTQRICGKHKIKNWVLKLMPKRMNRERSCAKLDWKMIENMTFPQHNNKEWVK